MTGGRVRSCISNFGPRPSTRDPSCNSTIFCCNSLPPARVPSCDHLFQSACDSMPQARVPSCDHVCQSVSNSMPQARVPTDVFDSDRPMSVLLDALGRALHCSPIGRVRSWLIKMRVKHMSINRSDSDSAGTSASAPGSLLPTPLPRRPFGRCPGSPRRRARWNARVAAFRCAEWLTAAFSFWELSCPKTVNQLKEGFWSLFYFPETESSC